MGVVRPRKDGGRVFVRNTVRSWDDVRIKDQGSVTEAQFLLRRRVVGAWITAKRRSPAPRGGEEDVGVYIMPGSYGGWPSSFTPPFRGLGVTWWDQEFTQNIYDLPMPVGGRQGLVEFDTHLVGATCPVALIEAPAVLYLAFVGYRTIRSRRPGFPVDVGPRVHRGDSGPT
jgi:hypothetical protein